MKKLFYRVPELQFFTIAIEQGFALSSNVEDPEVNPDKPW